MKTELKTELKKSIGITALAFFMLITGQPVFAETVYHYDIGQRLTRIDLDSGASVIYTYDNIGNITEVKSFPANIVAPTIKTQPKAVAAVSGQKVTFAVGAEGSGLRYKWRKAGVDIADATKSSYIIDAVVAADAADYDVVVTNDYGTVTSSTAALTVATANGTLKMAVSSASAGTTDPAADSLIEFELGGTQNITATSNIGYSFTHWSLNGNSGIDNLFSPIAVITLKGNTTATANFAETASTSTLTVDSDPLDGGKTIPSGPATLKNSEEVTVQALPADGFYFVEWTSDVPVLNENYNPSAAKTKVAISADTALTANFARKSPTGSAITKMKATIKMDNPAAKSGTAVDKDSIKISNMPLGAQFPVNGFTTDKLQSFAVDGELFNFTGGTWKEKTDKWSFKTDKGSVPKLAFNINLKDTKNPVCSFSVSGLTIDQINNGDGIDIYVTYDGTTYGANFAMDEKSTWNFDSAKNISAVITDLPLAPMDSFGIAKSGGKSDTVKKQKDGIVQNKDSWNVSKAAAECPFDPANDTVIITADSFSTAIPAGSFQNKKGKVYTYESKADGIKVVLDFDKNIWALKTSNNDCTGVTAADGIDMTLSIGTRESGIAIYPAHKTTLSYPKK